MMRHLGALFVGLLVLTSVAEARFRSGGGLPHAFNLHSATLLADGTVLIAGGIHGAWLDRPCSAKAFRYDPRTGKTQPTGSMAQARCEHSATLLADGSVLIVGGETACPFSGLLATAELYRPATGKFEPAGALSAPRSAHVAVAMPEGHVLIIGGIGEDRARKVPTIERYEPGRGMTVVGNLLHPRYGHTATLLRDGNVLIVGGHPPERDSQSITSVEKYLPATRRSVELPPLSKAREDHTATLLTDGSVLIIGGRFAHPKIDNDPTHASIERYDITTGQWTAAGTLKAARFAHTASLLPGGEVLILCGDTYDHYDGPLAGAEVYDPRKQQTRLSGETRLRRSSHHAVQLKDGPILIIGGTNDRAYDAAVRSDFDPNLAEIFLP